MRKGTQADVRFTRETGQGEIRTSDSMKSDKRQPWQTSRSKGEAARRNPTLNGAAKLEKAAQKRKAAKERRADKKAAKTAARNRRKNKRKGRA